MKCGALSIPAAWEALPARELFMHKNSLQQTSNSNCSPNLWIHGPSQLLSLVRRFDLNCLSTKVVSCAWAPWGDCLMSCWFSKSLCLSSTFVQTKWRIYVAWSMAVMCLMTIQPWEHTLLLYASSHVSCPCLSGWRRMPQGSQLLIIVSIWQRCFRKFLLQHQHCTVSAIPPCSPIIPCENDTPADAVWVRANVAVSWIKTRSWTCNSGHFDCFPPFLHLMTLILWFLLWSLIIPALLQSVNILFSFLMMTHSFVS